ncbi:ABC transporter ATP-binding protein [Candidatus Micrarchaeota archaeon]|nr:ABC transporter ATP-binding protein [Candidatus Micrarchaeota archaeon]
MIEIQNATKEYTTGQNTFKALKGVSLKIKKGEFVSIMGPSGSGKSTLLHLLGALDIPTSGEIYLSGRQISKMNADDLAEARNKKIGFVFQAFNLSPTLNVYKNVELPLIISEVDENKREKIVREKIAVVGLSGKENNKSSQLSGGEKQRVAIARALANNPEVVLADEPTGNLDSKTGTDIMDFLSSLWREHQLTIILVTHEPVVASYSQRIIHIRDGKIEKETLQKARIPISDKGTKGDKGTGETRRIDIKIKEVRK